MLAALRTAIRQPKTYCDELPGRHGRYSREPRKTRSLTFAGSTAVHPNN